MGCGSSKTETEDVKRCKARKQLIKQAVAHRHAFAAAHAAYIQSLKSTGAAIRQFADVEVPQQEGGHLVAPAAPPQIQLPQSTAKPPPPLPPDKPRLQDSLQDPFSKPFTPLPRAHSMPPLVITSIGVSASKISQVFHPQAVDEDEEEYDEAQGYSQHKPIQSEPLFHIFDNIRVPETSTSDIEDFEVDRAAAEGTVDDESGLGNDVGYQEPVLVVEAKRVVEEKAVFERERTKQPHAPIQQRLGKTDKDLGTLLRLLDDLFLKSYEAGRKVSLLLEAPRQYHHEPFVDEKYGIKEHNKKVSHILTWTRSSVGEFLADDHSPNDINLASTLDRLHAWEKKLYDEIKALETTRLELNRRTAQLKHQKERREAAATIEKTKALVKSLQTKHLVEFQAVDAALLEVTKLRDDNLHPQLKNIVKALSAMWEMMRDCYQKQIPIVEELKTLEVTPSIKETSDLCKEITDDLEREVTLWHDSLEKVVTFQEKCVTALLDWLHLNAKQIESEAVGSLEPPSRKAAAIIPLHDLCQEWADALKEISAEQVLFSLTRFSNILQDMATKQENEIKQKKRKEDIQKEWEKEKKSLEALESKYKEKSTRSQEVQESRHPVQEKKALVDLLEKNLEEERQRHARMCEENSTMMLQSLKDGLPEVLHSVLGFSQACVVMYHDLDHDVQQ